MYAATAQSYDRMALILDPGSGMYIDPTTGAVFHDPAGLQPSTDPSLTSQAQRGLAVSNQLLRGLGQYGAQYQQAVQGQNQLGQYLNRQIQGAAPSVAQGQLQQGLGQIRAGLDSQASGANGVNASLARYGAQQGYANAASEANQAAAIERAHETAQAVQAKGQLLGQQAGEAGNMYQTQLGGAGQFSGQAAQTANAQAQIDQQNRQAWMNFISNLAGGAGAAAVKFGTGGAAAPTAGPTQYV